MRQDGCCISRHVILRGHLRTEEARGPATPLRLGLGRMSGRDEPTDPGAKGGARQHVRWKMFTGRDTERGHPYSACIEEEGVPRPVRQMLPPRDHPVGRRGRLGDRVALTM
jgi:hypothetical protein